MANVAPLTETEIRMKRDGQVDMSRGRLGLVLWRFPAAGRTFDSEHDQYHQQERVQSHSQPDHIRLNASEIAQQAVVSGALLEGLRANSGDMPFHMPIIDVIGAHSRHDAPDESYGKITRHIGRYNRPDRIDHRIEVHLSIQKPEKRIEEEGRPIPCQCKARGVAGAKLAKLLQVPVGIRANEGFPELAFIKRCGRGSGKGCATLPAKDRLIRILLSAFFTGFHVKPL